MPKPFWCRAFCGCSESDVLIFELRTLHLWAQTRHLLTYMVICLYVGKQRSRQSIEVDCTSFAVLIWFLEISTWLKKWPSFIKWLITTNANKTLKHKEYGTIWSVNQIQNMINSWSLLIIIILSSLIIFTLTGI